MCNIETIWNRILVHEGEQFETISGLPFTYEIAGNIFLPDRANQNIPRSEFEKAIAVGLPIDGPGEISDLVRGSAYIWAVLHDRRIRQAEW
ncbi:hypothetical protein [Elongatibacter sediminis]|uniref:Uncharacterized protein n=1 Tax=Elongatibacter sediminis TaxID=3119006 RepID=A0AAW9RMT0_9GAMM